MFAENAERVHFWCIISVVLLLIALSEAYTGLLPPDPANPGKCIFRDEVLHLGVNPGTAPCQQLTCNSDGSVLIEGCGKLRIGNCNNGERLNPDKPYPQCCKLKYKCKQPDGTPFYIEKDVSDDAMKTENAA